MRWPFRRDTVIALRATREAHRIATQIANPPLKIEQPSRESRSKEDRQSLASAENLVERNSIQLQSGETDEVVTFVERALELAVFYAALLIVLWIIFNPRS